MRIDAVDVVNVGDGACTVVRRLGETMVMDCGSWNAADGKVPTILLRATLGALAPIPSTVVVTHFDLDHWMGLKAFADASSIGSESVRLIYPRFPSQAKPAQAALLAYQILHLTAPERSALDLFNAWASKSASLSRTAAHAGDTFAAVGTSWNVLWPPRTLTANVSKEFGRVAKESQDLANMYEPLARALEWTYESQMFTDDERENDLHGDDNSAVGEDAPHLAGYDLFDAYGAADFADAPADLQKRLLKNRADVQNINNELSRVVEEAHGRLLNLGDVQGWGLNELIRRDSMRGCYGTILAPHHGTQVPGVRTSPYFPWSDRVIAQNGPRHRVRRKEKERSAHTQELISTADSGTLIFRLQWHWSCYCP